MSRTGRYTPSAVSSPWVNFLFTCGSVTFTFYETRFGTILDPKGHSIDIHDMHIHTHLIATLTTHTSWAVFHLISPTRLFY